MHFKNRQTAFWLFKPMTYLAALSSPLAWLAIGAKLADISLVEAISSRDSWIYSFIKVLVVPFINLIALYILTVTNILPNIICRISFCNYNDGYSNSYSSSSVCY